MRCFVTSAMIRSQNALNFAYIVYLKLRAQGGALFGDRRYGRVFTYHNGAESYYAARGFRALLRV